ncbi:MAG: TorF family putative porin [Telluria sp.]
MKKKKLAVVVLALLACARITWAEETQPEHQLSYNASVVSDYRYRGISQTRLDPALQGGLDYTNTPSGLYAGTWLSTIKWVHDSGGDANVEWDAYGGKRGDLGNGVSYDVGGLYYFYPRNGLPTSANTFELYGQLGFGPAYVKYSNSLTSLFGTADSKHSGYLDVGANLETGMQGLAVQLHAGRQEVRHNAASSYTDYKIGLSKDLGVATLALAWVRTTTTSYRAPDGANLGKSAAVLSLSKTF